MQFHAISGDIDVLQISNGVVAGTSDTQVLSEVNMAGQFEAVLFILNLGTVTSTAVGTFRARGSATAGGEGTSGTVNCLVDPLSGSIVNSYCFTGDSNLPMYLDFFRPLCQYIKPELVRATANIVILAATAVLYNSRTQPWVPSAMASHSASGPGYNTSANSTLSLT